MANDGRMPCRWINLYGTEPTERSERTKRRREGSAYLGRVLIRFDIVSNDKPQLSSQAAIGVKDPRFRLYRLWVDVFDLMRCQVIPPGSKVVVVGTVAKYKTVDWPAKYNRKQDCYRWAEAQVPEILPDEGIKLPLDLSQVPDIFVNF